MKVYIPADRSPYGGASDAEIKTITTRIRVMARELGLETGFHLSLHPLPGDCHTFNKEILEIARGGVDRILDPDLAAAAEVADRECPLR